LNCKQDWPPSDDEERLDFLPDDEYDGFESIPFVQPKGRNSRAKKQPERVWYDDTMENVQQPAQHILETLCLPNILQKLQICRWQLHVCKV
jgi:hypothetical protein